MISQWSTQDVTINSSTWTQVNAILPAASATVFNLNGPSAIRISPDTTQPNYIPLPPGSQQILGDGSRHRHEYQFMPGAPICWLKSESGTFIVTVVTL